MVRFGKINPYENFGSWWFTILNNEKKYFETLAILQSTRHYVIQETTHNEKKLLKRLELLLMQWSALKTKTTINTSFYYKYIED